MLDKRKLYFYKNDIRNIFDKNINLKNLEFHFYVDSNLIILKHKQCEFVGFAQSISDFYYTFTQSKRLDYSISDFNNDLYKLEKINEVIRELGDSYSNKIILKIMMVRLDDNEIEEEIIKIKCAIENKIDYIYPY